MGEGEGVDKVRCNGVGCLLVGQGSKCICSAPCSACSGQRAQKCG